MIYDLTAVLQNVENVKKKIVVIYNSIWSFTMNVVWWRLMGFSDWFEVNGLLVSSTNTKIQKLVRVWNMCQTWYHNHTMYRINAWINAPFLFMQKETYHMKCKVISLISLGAGSPVQEVVIVDDSASKVTLWQHRDVLLVVVVCNL